MDFPKPVDKRPQLSLSSKSGLITLLFTVRDRVLSWQKGTVKW